MNFLSIGIFFGFCLSFSIRFQERLGCTILNANKQIRLHSYERMAFSMEHIEKCARSLMKEASESFSGSLELMFPSAVWHQEENAFLVVVRVVVDGGKSFVYAALFNDQWQQISEERSLGKIQLPNALPIQVSDYSKQFSGPEDSRVFRAPNGNYMCIFNMLDADGKRKMFLFNFETAQYHSLYLEQYSSKESIPSAEKNWTPLIVQEETKEGAKSQLYFVYNFKNAQVMKCKEAECSLINGEFDPVPGIIKGGSPFYRFHRSDYYFCISYTHYHYDKSNPYCIVYRPTITLVKATTSSGSQLKFTYIYNSEPMEFGQKLFALPNGQAADLCGNSRILIVVSVPWIDLSKDESLLTVNVNDNEPLLVKILGLERFISRAVYAYEHQFLRFSLACAESLAVAHFGTKEEINSL